MLEARALPRRVPRWPEQLLDYVEQRRHMPFAWGQNDCVSFAAGAVSAMTGAPAASLLPVEWATERQALRALESTGGLEAAVTRVLGPALQGLAARRAPRGSVVLVELQGRPTLGVSMGLSWCGPGEHGLVFRRMAEVDVAWSI